MPPKDAALSPQPSTSAGYRSPMSKALTIFGMVVAGLVAIVFAADAAVGIPFEGARLSMDIGAIIGAVILGYLSWDAFRDAK
jgi:hypothetical protein